MQPRFRCHRHGLALLSWTVIASLSVTEEECYDPLEGLKAEQNEEAVDSMEIPPPEDLATTIQFSYHTNAQMITTLKKVEERCSDIATTYSIGRSMEGRELLVIAFSVNPG
ncbi:Carboxypeptidase Z [Larimichthys crocea]|uniref:Uncharacterized protein n=1 Tax=Larimichthys crocea TaxID=215358 RepID=A0ACD3Q4S0_LARCR|nr:Carboxypeptidase Z [Larimichthys crocea]